LLNVLGQIAIHWGIKKSSKLLSVNFSNFRANIQQIEGPKLLIGMFSFFKKICMISLYNTLTNKKETFTPLDLDNIKMYACGPTVNDWAHICNARSVVVYDVLFRLLAHAYSNVTYVRNITDIDDKSHKPINITQRLQLTDFTADVSKDFTHRVNCNHSNIWTAI
jgi:hypothetical protein